MTARHPTVIVESEIVDSGDNVFEIIGKVVTSLRCNHVSEVEISEFLSDVYSCGSYEEALDVIRKTVTVL